MEKCERVIAMVGATSIGKCITSVHELGGGGESADQGLVARTSTSFSFYMLLQNAAHLPSMSFTEYFKRHPTLS